MPKAGKDKQYQSAREHKSNSMLRSGRIGSNTHNLGTVQRKISFKSCALTLVPFKDPVCTSKGIVFDKTALITFLLDNKKDPVTGQPCGKKDIITLHMDKDDEGRWQCPIITKAFHDHTKVVAIRDRETKSAYVYSYEAYKELNVQSKNWTDLTTGKPFHPKKDVLILNDPSNEAFQKQRDVSTFWHIKNARHIKKSSKETNVRHSVTATRIMDKIQKDKATKAEEDRQKKKADEEAEAAAAKASNRPKRNFKILAEDVTGIKYTSGKSSSSFTSTSMEVQVDNTGREATEEEILQSQFRVMRGQPLKYQQQQKQQKDEGTNRKGYVRLHTNLGLLLLELHCDIVPRTCTNFLGLCEQNKYNGTKFHRLIRNFMIQGGKANDEADDVSLWGTPFEDEFDDRLKHTGGGMLSMANAGPKTNQRQFFITFKSCPHLDRKHSVFGSVIKGLDIVKKMEQQPTDKKNRPLDSIIIEKTVILVNPAKEAYDFEMQRLEQRWQERLEEQNRKLGRKSKSSADIGSKKKRKKAKKESSVGKYLKQAADAEDDVKDKNKDDKDGKNDDDGLADLRQLKVKAPKNAPAKTTFGNFSGW